MGDRTRSLEGRTSAAIAMVLCMLLQRGQTMQRGEEIKAALRRTRAIWMRSSSSSREAQKGVETVSIILVRFSVDPTHRGPPDAYAENRFHSEDANPASQAAATRSAIKAGSSDAI
ncbi:hypothetical protein VSDG_09868 [Cytospora chrysosperma]|uniref:Secreted protein n=1 Tax=Cytospora chrysosperma TaxID=252740 RepID=A0A423V922_CYTCH|nr:hypothetical protein VSDG_09868 [Valsa sordida]